MEEALRQGRKIVVLQEGKTQKKWFKTNSNKRKNSECRKIEVNSVRPFVAGKSVEFRIKKRASFSETHSHGSAQEPTFERD